MKNMRLISIMLSITMLLGLETAICYSATSQEGEYGKNGVAYILVGSELQQPQGVYRFNESDGSVASQPWRVFSTSNVHGKVSGLSASQRNEVFLLSAPIRNNSMDGYTSAPVGWLPTSVSFPDDSPIYLKVAQPNAEGLSDYAIKVSENNASHVHGSSYWKKNFEINSIIYKYAVQFGGPTGVKYLNCTDGIIGTPIWDGTFFPSSSNAAAIKHPNDESKIILPSHFGALAYYLYGTSNADSSWQNKQLDGTNGLPTLTYKDASRYGNWHEGISKKEIRDSSDPAFAAIVKRVYLTRDNNLDLYTGKDETDRTSAHSSYGLSVTDQGVLKTKDVIANEYFGKHCGDNCIPGRMIDGQPIEASLSNVTVVTSTRGFRYGFNPLGIPNATSGINSSLRRVKNGTETTLPISTDPEGNDFSSNITNREYLIRERKTPSSLKTIGVSSNFNGENDFIYGSAADAFVVQDSWWGVGGLAYEYTKNTDGLSGSLVKLDYTNNVNPNPEPVGQLTGKIDSIGIDGDGYLYALKTEEYPKDEDVENLQVSNDPNSPQIISTISPNGNLPTDNTGLRISCWKRVVEDAGGESTSVIDIPDGQEKNGDYKIATFKQAVYKVLKRYPQTTGNISTEEDRGHLFVGQDKWTNYLRKTSQGNVWDSVWVEENGALKVSNIKTELAVVNVASAPKSINAKEDHYICEVDSNGISTRENINGRVIGEQEHLLLKVEGYKPYGKKFKSVGKHKFAGGTNEEEIKLNNIPAPDGSYDHDEDGDGNTSGFPSCMFESSTTYKTTVTWKIARVENTSAVELDSSAKKLIGSIEEEQGQGDFLILNYNFKQPGRYIIEADVKYNFFDNFGSAERPDQLTVSSKSFTTKPILVNVYANALNLNKSESYITNITLKTTNQSNGIEGSIDEENLLPNLDCLEDDGDFSEITISFDTQFYYEKADNTEENLQTFDGIGVWDYRYYVNLYRKAQTKVPGITIPSEKSDWTRAYNFRGDNTIEYSYDPNIYNPGKLKTSNNSTDQYTAGTKVNGEISKTDDVWSFIQWALYLRRTKPYEDIPVPDDGMKERGFIIANGTCNNADITAIPGYTRKYKVKITIPKSQCKINTPRDPQDYTLDLEIIYPRVSWLNNNLGSSVIGTVIGTDRPSFSNVVPYNSESKASPIHVISKLITSPVADDDKIINQSNETMTNAIADTVFTSNSQSLTLRVHDKTTPTIKGPVTKFNNANIADRDLPLKITTGESCKDIDVAFSFIDNNPFVSVEPQTKTTAKKISKDEAKKAAYLAIQKLKEDKFTNQVEFIYERNSGETTCTDIISSSETDNYAQDNNWNIQIDYNVNIPASSDKFKPSSDVVDDFKKLTGEEQQLSIFGEPLSKIHIENWVGKLNYCVVGWLCDGYGQNNNRNKHWYYNKDVFKDLSLTEESDPIDVQPVTYLERLDNDPPNIMVEIVSQADNRRWNYQLLENVHDTPDGNKLYPTDVTELAKSTLKVTGYKNKGNENNDNEIVVFSEKKEDIPGTTSVPQRPTGCQDEVTVGLVKPKFKNTARLLISVSIIDNCGFLQLSDANIEVGIKSGEILLNSDMNKEASHDEKGNIKEKFKTQPRGVFVVDIPSKIPESKELYVKVTAKDNAGNTRILTIPANIVESSFETRTLETKEERL